VCPDPDPPPHAGDAAKSWPAYYDATAGRPPRRTLLEALARFTPSEAPRVAVDLGSGDGRDAIELLRRSWQVLAIDAEAAALERLRQRPDLPPGARLETLCQRFEEAAWPPADLVNASFSLPLCPPDAFPALWQRITDSLKPGGRFAGQLYGERDGWVGRSGMTHLTRAEAERLLASLDIELFEEEETDSVTPRGTPKHWHIFHVVARRRE
jgi:tellurite methyltransferase